MKKSLFLVSSVLLMTLLLVQACKTKKEDVGPKVQEEEVVEIQTNYGSMYVWLYKATPLHRANFLKLASENYFDSTTFHRVIPNFMIQGGDPNSRDADSTNDGTGGPGYTIPAEISDTIKHARGVLAAARTNNPQKASSGSQFYISVSTAGTAGLDKNYTVFGFVMKGMEYADSIVYAPRNKLNDRPFKNQYMKMKVIKMTKSEIKNKFNYDAKL
jgi:cyclophilin family peptidyl-prolyl cis-trans isomerase